MLVVSWASSAPSAPLSPQTISYAWKDSLILFFFPFSFSVSQIAADVHWMGKIKVTLSGCNTWACVRPDWFSSCRACHECFLGTDGQRWNIQAVALFNVLESTGKHRAAPLLHSGLISDPWLLFCYSPFFNLAGKLPSLTHICLSDLVWLRELKDTKEASQLLYLFPASKLLFPLTLSIASP